jgi:hypothetical protein
MIHSERIHIGSIPIETAFIIYYPDFKIDDYYIEIKEYHSDQFDAKKSQFPSKLIVLYKTDLQNIFNYVTYKYGKNFTYLYEK